jgi:formamidopyrimidine-DNA glycosylase
MPELPEVETIRQDLKRKILDHKIVDLKIFQNKSVNNEKEKFLTVVKGNSVRDIRRRGKLMIFDLKKGEESILVHLKMTGQLIYEKVVIVRERPHPALSLPRRGGGETKVEIIAGGHKLTEKDFDLPNQHTRVVLTFADGGKLFFNDLRRFGYMKLASPEKVGIALNKFGPEPLEKDFTWEYFQTLFKKRTAPVKAVLMNQELIAGIGNIYADEACFCAHVRPMRRANTLVGEEKKKLFVCIPKILRDAIKHRGTTFKDYMDTEGKKGNYTSFLRVYDRDGEKCLRCGEIIQKTKSAGRGTHYCPQCQK